MRAALALIATTIALALATPTFAQRPADAGQGRGKGHGRGDAAGPGHPGPAPGGVAVSVTIAPADQLVIRQHYTQQAAAGHCPPGLAKKHNGCLPPGQAKKWAVGQPLPMGVAYYPLPPALLGRLRPAPAGYLYVQVGGDVLLMGANRMIVSMVGIF